MCFHSSAAQNSYRGQQKTGYFSRYAHPINTRWSVDMAGGIAIYTGELSSPKDGNLQNGYGNFSWGPGVGFRLTQYLNLAAKYRGFRLASESDPEFWNHRSFTTKNRQVTLNLEHNIFPHREIENTSKKINFHLSVGIGINKFTSTVDDPPVDSPIVVEESTTVIPVGAGIAYYINPNTNITLQGHFYNSGSDLLDGTALGQGPNDGFFIFEFQYQWQIANGFIYKNYLRHRGRQVR